jgi:hypothetical protein
MTTSGQLNLCALRAQFNATSSCVIQALLQYHAVGLNRVLGIIVTDRQNTDPANNWKMINRAHQPK